MHLQATKKGAALFSYPVHARFLQPLPLDPPTLQDMPLKIRVFPGRVKSSSELCDVTLNFKQSDCAMAELRAPAP
jgi:hypothetical protein